MFFVLLVLECVFLFVAVLFLLLIYLKANKWFEDPLLFHLVSCTMFFMFFSLTCIHLIHALALPLPPHSLCIHGMCLFTYYFPHGARTPEMCVYRFLTRLCTLLFFFVSFIHTLFFVVYFICDSVQLKRRVYVLTTITTILQCIWAWQWEIQQHAGSDK